LASVRERIEQLDASRAALDQRIQYADVHVSLVRVRPPFWQQPFATIGAAASWGVDAVCAVAVGSVAALAAIGPMLVLFALALAALIVAARTLRRRWA
jgi:hypothetical protein